MNPKSLSTNLAALLITALLATTAACASKPQTKSSDGARGDRYTMAGYEFSARKGVDTLQSIPARFGPPTAEESAGASNQFKIFSYPAKDQPEKLLLLLFHGHELIGVFRESDRQSLTHTIVSYERHLTGRRGLFQSNYPNNIRVNYCADREHLARTPKMRSNKPPLSEDEATCLAIEWRQQNHPNLQDSDPRLQLHHIKDLPGIAYYSVDIAGFYAQPEHRKILILMDGTIITGELEPK